MGSRVPAARVRRESWGPQHQGLGGEEGAVRVKILPIIGLVTGRKGPERSRSGGWDRVRVLQEAIA